MNYIEISITTKKKHLLDLWADKIHVSSVKALGYSVKIFECKSAEALFTKKSSKLKRKESTRGQLGT